MATSEDMFKRLGQNLRRALDASGRTVDEVAEQALMEKTEVEQMIAGVDLDITVEALVVLGGAIDVEHATLLDGVRWVPHRGRPGGEYTSAEN